MFRSISTLAATALTTMTLATGVRAQDTTVRVALLDITSVAPTLTGQAPGAFGLMGRGGFGQGMMGGLGQGYRPGGGMGMMGFGMMSVRADVSTVKAGAVTFDVTNWSRSVVHEMLVIAVDGPDAALPYDYRTDKVIEDQVKMLGETDEMQPSATKGLSLDLAPGNYLLICNVPGHYGAGMQTPFTVTE